MAARSLARVGLPQHLLHRLQACNVQTARELFSRTLLDLVELLDLPYETVSELLVAVAAKIVPPPITALDLLQQAAARPVHLRSTLQPLDAALHGGIPAGSITEVVGPAGLGKTQFCLTLAVVGCLEHAAEGGTVLYVDTESKFSSKRLSEIARARFPQSFPSQEAVEAMLPRILILNPLSSADLVQRLATLESVVIDHNVRLIIIDSVAALARSDFGAGSVAERQAMLSQQAAQLKYLAETFGIPILVTNQVTALVTRDAGPGGAGGAAGAGTERAGGQLTAALGTLWAHAVNTRLVLESVRGSRFIRIAKSPAAPAAAFAFAVTTAGLELREGVPVPPELLAAGSVVDQPIANEVPYEQAEAFMAE